MDGQSGLLLFVHDKTKVVEGLAIHGLNGFCRVFFRRKNDVSAIATNTFSSADLVSWCRKKALDCKKNVLSFGCSRKFMYLCSKSNYSYYEEAEPNPCILFDWPYASSLGAAEVFRLRHWFLQSGEPVRHLP